MDLDTLCIKFWANGCIVRYDILVTGEPGRAVSQQGPRTTQLSFNRELTSHQTEYWHLQLQCWQILDTPPLLSSSLCNCILFIWCRSQPSTDWYRVLLLLLLLYTQAQSSSKWRSQASFFTRCITGRTKIMYKYQYWVVWQWSVISGVSQHVLQSNPRCLSNR